jgi:ankyrin repeat protein
MFHFNADLQVISSLEAGCPVDIRDTAGNTLFIIAAQNGNKNMCKVNAMKNLTDTISFTSSLLSFCRHFFAVVPI